MMKKNNAKMSRDKVVLIIDHAVKCNSDANVSSSYRFIKSVIDGLLSVNGVNSERIFIGGSKEKLECFLATILKDFQSYQCLDLKFGFEYEGDEDFEYDPDKDQEEQITNP